MRWRPYFAAGVMCCLTALVGCSSDKPTSPEAPTTPPADGPSDPDPKEPTAGVRPLNGVWATAPFLHNGSVPNLYQLLLPAKDRVKTFYVGSREFDPVNVGFDTKSFPGGFLFRTVDDAGQPIPGNANSGHEGEHYTQTKSDDGSLRDFTDEERRALVEYMKTLK